MLQPRLQSGARLSPAAKPAGTLRFWCKAGNRSDFDGADRSGSQPVFFVAIAPCLQPHLVIPTYRLVKQFREVYGRIFADLGLVGLKPQLGLRPAQIPEHREKTHVGRQLGLRL